LTSFNGGSPQVIEAVIEHVPLKQQIFQELEAICSKDCILSTNTSTIDINVCAAKMKNPHRIVGACSLTLRTETQTHSMMLWMSFSRRTYHLYACPPIPSRRCLCPAR
jgi:hypothetical protein